jgi:hypothetical protein
MEGNMTIPKKVMTSIMGKIPWMGISILCSALLLSCSHTLSKVTTVMTLSKTTAMTRDRITVDIDRLSDDFMRIKLTIANHGKETIMISPSDIRLRIVQMNEALQVVEDFKSYIIMGYTKAKKECLLSSNLFQYRHDVEKRFRPFFEAKPFQFGIIMPGIERSGYITFNLPDPFSPSKNMQCVNDSLGSKTKQLDGNIEITALALSKDRHFVFPVKIASYFDAKLNPMVVRASILTQK